MNKIVSIVVTLFLLVVWSQVTWAGPRGKFNNGRSGFNHRIGKTPSHKLTIRGNRFSNQIRTRKNSVFHSHKLNTRKSRSINRNRGFRSSSRFNRRNNLRGSARNFRSFGRQQQNRNGLIRNNLRNKSVALRPRYKYRNKYRQPSRRPYVNPHRGAYYPNRGYYQYGNYYSDYPPNYNIFVFPGVVGVGPYVVLPPVRGFIGY